MCGLSEMLSLRRCVIKRVCVCLVLQEAATFAREQGFEVSGHRLARTKHILKDSFSADNEVLFFGQ